jgi:hypothetical protein
VTPDPKLNYAGAPTVTLGGEEFFVPVLALRQARVVVPGIMELMPRLNAIQRTLARSERAGVFLSESDVDLMIDVVHAALTRAYPQMTRDDLLDREASFAQLVVSISVIARQTGLFAAATPGEQQGETAAPPISMESSPNIANVLESPGPTPSNPN